ncbi:MAG: FadR/GntR family transcriptional regulator [Candidatus Dormibacteraceae bacterium]
MPVPFPRDPRLKLSDHVATDLEQWILRDYHPGQRLPTEPELCARFGVSRTVVRDALRTLSSIGLVAVRQGVGIVVVQPAEETLTHMLSVRLQASDVTVGDVLDARQGLETALGAEAGRRATAEDRQALREEYERMAEHVGARRWEAVQAAHLAFHRRLLHALHLPALELMLLPLQEVILISQLPPDLEDADYWDLPAHEAILEALGRGSPEEVSRTIRAHFQNTTVGAGYQEFRSLKFREARDLPSYRALAPHAADLTTEPGSGEAQPAP